MPPPGASILFVGPSKIGDAVLVSGVLTRLTEENLGARFTIAAGPAALPLFRDWPGLERLIPLQKRGRFGHWLDLWRRTRGVRWEAVLDTRGSALPLVLRVRRRTPRARPPAAPEHRVITAARLLGLAQAPPAPHLFTTSATEAAAAARLAPLAGRPILALGPAASWEGKAWPAERYVQLAAALLGEGGALAGAGLLILGGPGDQEVTAPLRRAAAPGAIVDLTGAVDPLEAYAALRHARLFVGADSGLMHLAAAAGAPTLGLFGPSDERLYAPWGDKARLVRGPRDFAAFKAIDPRLNQRIGHMDDLSVDAVTAAAERLLAEMAKA